MNAFEVTVEDKDFVCGSNRWEIPQTHYLKVKTKNRLIFGIRPEDIKVYSQPKPDSFSAQLIAIEKMGKYAILNLNCQGQALKAVVEKDFTNKINRDNLWIEFDKQSLYLFTIDTQESL